MRHQGQICTCIWQGFIHKGIFSDVLSDKMAEWGMMRHRGLRSVHEKRQVLADMSSVEVELVSDSYTNMDRCWALLNDEIDKAYITKPVAIGADLAKSLSESQVCKTNCVGMFL